MGAYGKVSYTDSDDKSQEVLSEKFEASSVVDSQVNKFDTSYAIEKLQELYNEYDKITLDEDKIQSATQTKVNVISSKIPFRVLLVLTTSVIVTLLFTFLCFYNISVINKMGSGINYLQEEVTAYEYSLVQAEGLYDNLTNTHNIQRELDEMGFSDSSSNIVTVNVADKANVTNLQGETNWFDAICNFLSRLFG